MFSVYLFVYEFLKLLDFNTLKNDTCVRLRQVSR